MNVRRALLLVVALAACGGDDGDDAPGADAAPPPPIFAEITDEALGSSDAVVPVDPGDTPCVGPGPLPDPCTVMEASFGVGAAAGDLDGDGDDDLLFAGPDGGRWRRNQSSPGALALAAPEPLLAEAVYVHGLALGDLDGDGDLDLVAATAQGARILDNQGGALVDTGFRPAAPTRATSATIADWNRDGALDVHVSVYGVPGAATDTSGPGHLLLNRGGFVFEDVAAAWPPRHGWASLAVDADADGALDLLLCAESWNAADDEAGTALLFGDGADPPVFVEEPAVAGELLRFTTPMGAAAGDVDGDGDVELLVMVTGPSVYLQRPDGAGARGFDVTSFFAPTADEAYHTSWSASFLDPDGDGALEALLVGGSPCSPGFCAIAGLPDAQSHRLIRWQGGFGYLAERRLPLAGGFSPADGDGAAAAGRNGRGVVRVDLDGDAHDEWLITPFRDRFRLFREIAPAPVVRVRLHGSASSPRPCGAHVTLEVAGATRHRWLGCGGATHSDAPPELLFELGAAGAADVGALVVAWPAGGTTTIAAPAVDSRIDVVEP